MWLYWHMIALGDEYTKRYNKKHLTKTIRAAFFNNHSQGEGEGVL